MLCALASESCAYCIAHLLPSAVCDWGIPLSRDFKSAPAGAEICIFSKAFSQMQQTVPFEAEIKGKHAGALCSTALLQVAPEG